MFTNSVNDVKETQTPLSMSNGSLNEAFEGFICLNTITQLQDLKKRNLNGQNTKIIESNAKTSLNELLELEQYDMNSIETLTLCFKSLYLIEKDYHKSIDLIRRHQVFIINLINQKFLSESLQQLNTLYHVFNNLIHGKRINYSGLCQDIIFGISFEKIDDYRLIKQIIAWHFFLLQVSVQFISKNMKLVINNKDKFWNFQILNSISLLFVKTSHFIHWIDLANYEDCQKYNRNCIKMIKGFLNITLNLLKYKKDDHDLNIIKTSFILKIIDYDNDLSLKDDIIIEPQHIRFIDDLREHPCFGEISHKINSANSPEASQLLVDFIKTRDTQLIDKLKLQIINTQINIIDNEKLIKSILSFRLDTSSTSLAFLDIISSIILLSQISKKHLPIIDMFIVFIKDHIPMLHLHDSFYSVLSRLSVILDKGSQEKRLRNVSNILFNMGNKSRDPRYWKAAIDLEFSIIKKNDNGDNFNQVLMKTQKILNILYELKLFDYAREISITLFSIFDSSGRKASKFPILSQLVCKLILEDLILLQQLFEKSSEELRLDISVFILRFLESLPADHKTVSILDSIFEFGSFTDQNIGLVAYYYYNIGDKQRSLEIDTSLLNDLINVGISLRKLVNYSWDETLIKDTVIKMERWLLDKTSTSSLLEQEIFRLLIHVMKYNGAARYVSHLIELYNSHRTPDTAFQSFLHVELCSCLIHTSLTEFPVAITNFSTFLKKNKINTVSTVICLNLLQFEYSITVGNYNNAQDRFDKILKVLSSRDEFKLTTDKNISVADRYSNVLTIAKFQFLSARLNVQNNKYIPAHSNLKTSIKLLYSLIKKSTSSLSKDELNFLKWEIINLLFDCLKLMMMVLVHLGISRDLMYYLIEFHKLNEVNRIPLVNASNHLDFVVYYYLLKEKEKTMYHIECFRKLQEISLVFYDKETKDYSDSILPLIENKVLQKDTPIENFTNLTKKRFTSFDIAHLASLENSCIYASDIDIGSIPGRSLFCKDSIKKSIKALSTQAGFSSIHDSCKTIPCISSEGFSNSTFSPVEVLNRLIYCKDLLFSSLSTVTSVSTYLLRDFQNVLSYCLVLLSSMSVLKINTTLLMDLYYLQDFANALPFINDMLVDHSSNEILPGAAQQSLNLPDFKSSSMNLNVDMNLLIPSNWIIINIDLCNITGDLLVSKQVIGEAPFFLRIPLQRFKYRGQETKTFMELKMSFELIIKRSNLSTKTATTSSITTKDQRKEWWKLRFSLDMELKELMEHIEKFWFGGFASLFNTYVLDSVFKKFSQDFKNILNKHIPSRKNELNNFMEFHESVIRLFYEIDFNERLAIDDLIYFLLDSLSYHGELNNYGDLPSSLGTSIQKLLEKFQDIKTKIKNEHIILIPGVRCLFFPWESLSILRDKSVSRVPSVRILLNMLKNVSSDLTIEGQSKVHYLINPGGDLQRTESLFKNRFQAEPNWTGLVGEAPKEGELVNYLKKQDIFVYIGHGGCDQYVRPSSLFKEFLEAGISLPPSLLIGCSSGAIETNGFLEPSGNIINWITCGSPSVLVNLWDVTDKDIDLFSSSVFEKWGLFENRTLESICQAVSQSRDLCNLKYLNGSAPVVYGLPLSIK